MSGHSNITSFIIPVSLVSVCFLLLVNIWSTKTSNQTLSEDVGRIEAEMDMAQYQTVFCETQVKEKEAERKINLVEEESVKNQLRKALDAKKKLVSTKNMVKTQLDQVRAEKENNKGTRRQLEQMVEKTRADKEMQDRAKTALIKEKRKMEVEL